MPYVMYVNEKMLVPIIVKSEIGRIKSVPMNPDESVEVNIMKATFDANIF